MNFYARIWLRKQLMKRVVEIISYPLDEFMIRKRP